QSPERVVSMLNEYFAAGEQVWSGSRAIKAKLSADELMVIFPDALSAVQAALELQRAESRVLSGLGLGAGVGVHCGPVVEGLMGSREIKAYDVIGDVVNTAKRLCDQAAAGEVLISGDVYRSLGAAAEAGPELSLLVRGKELPLQVYPLLGLRG
ncbi:MAG: adenylate/guanylate cyclase domain-containing protein, partial [Chloroflexota bacterium]